MALVGLGKAITGNAYSNNGGSVKMGGTTAFAIDPVAVGGVPTVIDGDPNPFNNSLAYANGSSGIINFAVGTGYRAANDKSKLIDTNLGADIIKLRRGDAPVITSGTSLVFPERDIHGNYIGSELPYATGFFGTLVQNSGSDRGSPSPRLVPAIYNYKLGAEVHQKNISLPTT